ncbi:MAG TPA: DUF4406 domain-containing protein [Dissulfurispiraceae bacterium]|nr:DUF4406 domain-containing protein [Dissulfurispiraceae bacterium]
MSRNFRVYLSGPITGIEEKSAGLFSEAQKELESKGYEVVNPMALIHDHDKSWEWYMAVDILAMMGCDCICLLPGWDKSRGARLEHAIAQQKGMDCFFWFSKAEHLPAIRTHHPPGEAGYL